MAAMIVARFVWIFGVDAIVAMLRRMGLTRAHPLGARSALVMSWAGMRGVVTLAVALSLPEAMPARDLMLVTAFVAILVIDFLLAFFFNALTDVLWGGQSQKVA